MVMITAQVIIEANEWPGGKLLTMYLDLGGKHQKTRWDILASEKKKCQGVYKVAGKDVSLVISG